MKPNLLQYQMQRAAAKQRGIQWDLLFNEWREIWQKSGHWRKRGCKRGQYVMARRDHESPYVWWNVQIMTGRENNQMHHRSRHSLAEAQLSFGG